jgi:hypothetical protein
MTQSARFEHVAGSPGMRSRCHARSIPAPGFTVEPSRAVRAMGSSSNSVSLHGIDGTRVIRIGRAPTSTCTLRIGEQMGSRWTSQ